MTPGTPRVALIGYGMAGRDFHAPLLRAAGVPPAVVATGSPERAAQVRADLPGVPVDPWDAVATAEILDAARSSAAGGRRVPIMPSSPRDVTRSVLR